MNMRTTQHAHSQPLEVAIARVGPGEVVEWYEWRSGEMSDGQWKDYNM